jgi:hypothetical protein
MPGDDEGRPPPGAPAHIEALLPTKPPTSREPTARRPQHDPLCGRCGGPAGPEGAWCNNCIRICREYTRWLDLQQDEPEAA